jgi:hypothetical protein
MNPYRFINVRDCQGALWMFYSAYEGRAQASFEGDLSALRLYEIPGSSGQETALLKRQTIDPQLDFCIVPITAESIVALKSRLSAHGVLGGDGAVIHTQLATAEELIFIACDNFHNDCTVAARSVPEELLKAMKAHGVLREYGSE